MKNVSFVLVTLLFSSTTLAKSELADLVLTHTLIRNQTIFYKIEMSNGEIETRESELFSELQSHDDCSQYDLDGKYSSFQLITVTEEPNVKDEPGFSKWVEGNKVEGLVIAKTTQLCFAIAN